MSSETAEVHGTEVTLGDTKLVLDKDDAAIKVIAPFPKGTSKICWKIDFEGAGMGQYTAVLKFMKPNRPNRRPWKDPSKEVERLRALRNSGVEGIEDVIVSGICTVHVDDQKPYKTRYFVSRYVPFTEPLRDFVLRSPLHYGLDFVLTLMAKVLPILRACHQKKCLHLDLHPNNILISAGVDPNTQQAICEQVILIDFATAMDVLESYREGGVSSASSTTSPRATMVDGFRSFLHPFLRNYLDIGEPVPKNALRSPEAARFDLFAVARCLEEVLGRVDVPADEEVTRKSIAFVLGKLRNEGGSVTFGIDSALSAVERNRANLKKPTLVRLGGEINAVVPNRFVSILNSYQVQRLRRVYQLGFTHLVYPSATHSRFSHSVGVFHMCNQYINALQANSEIFRGMYDEKDLELLRIAALIHDIGHYPFSHYFEELWENDAEGANRRRRLPLKVHHERMAAEILETGLHASDERPERRDLSHALQTALPSGWAPLLKRFFDKNDDQFALLRSILSGPIDCDKVDYLMRDGHACGVPYADAIDTQRLLSSLTVCYDESQVPAKYILALTSKGVAPVESILNARYQMFSEVYWHKACRGVAAMVKHALYRVVREGLAQDEFDAEVLRDDDWHVLQWLATKLGDLGLDSVADDLIRHPLLDCDRNALYHRVITFSAIWDGRYDSEVWTTLSSIGRNKDYRQVVAIKNTIQKALNSELKSDFAKAGVGKIQEHQLLIDIPPAEEKFHSYPSIFYPETKNLQNVLKLNEVSGIHTLQMRGNQAQSPLELTHKIRVFTTRTYAQLIRNRWPKTQDLGLAFSKFIKSGT